jgi:hypothetical protein
MLFRVEGSGFGNRFGTCRSLPARLRGFLKPRPKPIFAREVPSRPGRSCTSSSRVLWNPLSSPSHPPLPLFSTATLPAFCPPCKPIPDLNFSTRIHEHTVSHLHQFAPTYRITCLPSAAPPPSSLSRIQILADPAGDRYEAALSSLGLPGPELLVHNWRPSPSSSATRSSAASRSGSWRSRTGPGCT